jgi:hypothetical protein
MDSNITPINAKTAKIRALEESQGVEFTEAEVYIDRLENHLADSTETIYSAFFGAGCSMHDQPHHAELIAIIRYLVQASAFPQDWHSWGKIAETAMDIETRLLQEDMDEDTV